MIAYSCLMIEISFEMIIGIYEVNKTFLSEHYDNVKLYILVKLEAREHHEEVTLYDRRVVLGFN